MHQFQRYNPAQPRTVTSFKGNQKLIFEGYRYNIHHIVPAKGVKTWRCVCAKKLTCSRSWCKGRAETWDGDGQGISKGEHNHSAEHEVAELEYFKSQLILAAIASPYANLNDLIDEATGFMSEGVSFGSRESLKKSLTVARKAAENGGFKLKCYKSSDKPFKSLAYNNVVAQSQLKPKETSPAMQNSNGTVPKKTTPGGTNPKVGPKVKCNNAIPEDNNSSNAHMMSLFSLTKQCWGDNGVDEKESNVKQQNIACTNSTYSPPSCCPSSAASVSSLLGSSGFHSGSSLNCSTTSCPNPSPLPPNSSSSSSSLLFAAIAATAAAAALNNSKSSSSNNSSTKKGAMCQTKADIEKKSAVKLPNYWHISAATATGRATSSGRPSNCATTLTACNKNSTNNQLQHNAQIVQRKKARVNSIFDRLSNKAAAAAATTSSSSPAQQMKQRRNIEFNVAETQTDYERPEEMEYSVADQSNKGVDGWRVVRICCCGDSAKCTTGQKRKWTMSAAAADEFDENITPNVEEHSPPPSTSSSVENQPQHNGIVVEKHAENNAVEGALMRKANAIKHENDH